LDAAIRTYDWVFKAKLVDAEGKVFDGTYAPRCWQIEEKEHSYNSGLFLGVAGLLYKATGDEKYIAASKTVLKRSEKVFTNGNGAIIDECEPTNSCKVNQAAFKGIFVRGLSYLYSNTKDQEIRSTIKNMVTKSVEGMAKTCSDGWACNNIWTPGAQVYTDVHTQNTALELLNTFSIVSKDGTGASGVTDGPKKSPTKVVPDAAETKPAQNEEPGYGAEPGYPEVSEEPATEVAPVENEDDTSTTDISDEDNLYLAQANSLHSFGMISLAIGYFLVI
jgi:hypothetical protein